MKIKSGDESSSNEVKTPKLSVSVAAKQPLKAELPSADPKYWIKNKDISSNTIEISELTEQRNSKLTAVTSTVSSRPLPNSKKSD